jgi:hypothetical protein
MPSLPIKISPFNLKSDDDYPDYVTPLAKAVAWELNQTFLGAEYSQAERHLRRLGKVAALEKPK